jgi:hypothetical protein
MGMVQHLTISDERFWFRGVVGGDFACISASDDEAIWQVPSGTPTAAVLDVYRREIELADADTCALAAGCAFGQRSSR